MQNFYLLLESFDSSLWTAVVFLVENRKGEKKISPGNAQYRDSQMP